MAMPTQIPACKFCKTGIPLADVNVATDIALCRACGKSMSYAEIAPPPEMENFDENTPPDGIRIVSGMRGREIVRKKISPIVWFFIPFTMLWSGLSMGGIYGSQIANGKFDLGRSFFGIPFLLGSIGLVTMILFMLFGRVVISLVGGELQVRIHVGPIGWRRKLSVDQEATVRIKSANWQRNNQPVEEIVVTNRDGKTLKFGAGFSAEGRLWMAEAVRRMIRSGGIS